MPKNVTAQLIDEINSHTIYLSRYTGFLRQKVLRHLKKLEFDTVEKINALGEKPPAMEQRARLERLLSQVQSTIKTNYRIARDSHIGELMELSGLESRFAATSINTILKVDLMTPLLTPQVLKSVVSDALIQGSPAAEWWSRQAENTRRKFSDQIRLGFSGGEDTQAMVRRIRGTATGKFINVRNDDGAIEKVREFKGGVMDLTTREAEALVRTSVQTIANDARLATYRDNDDVIKAMQMHVTFDDRTCPICQPLENMAWYLENDEPLPPEENNGIVSIPFSGPPPFHFHCRCSLVPITYSWQELAARAKSRNKEQRRIARIADNNLSTGTRQSMDGHVSQAMTYEDWLKTQSETMQKEVLGVGKWAMWKHGKISFSDMINQEGRPLSLKEIQARM